MEGALVGGAFSEEGHRDVVAPLLLEGERVTDRRRHALTDDPAASKVGDRIEQVHVAALAMPEAGLLAEDLGGQLLHVHAVSEGDMMWAVGRGYRVARAQVNADPCRDRLLPRRQVHLTGHGTGCDIEGGRLAFHVDLLDRLLENANPHHLAVHLELFLLTRHACTSLPRLKTDANSRDRMTNQPRRFEQTRVPLRQTDYREPTRAQRAQQIQAETEPDPAIGPIVPTN